jgi:hypothetical protein
VTMPSAEDSDGYTQKEWRGAVQDVPDQTPYRVVLLVEGEQYEKEDVANCISSEGIEGGGDQRQGVEWVTITVASPPKIATEDCPA